MTTEQRLERLERENRWMRRIGAMLPLHRDIVRAREEHGGAWARNLRIKMRMNERRAPTAPATPRGATNRPACSSE